MKSYCIREKRVTECVPGSERYERAKNGRLMLKCQCASCGITKTKFVKSSSGGAVDIHKMIGYLPKPKGGFTPGNYKYMGPYNPLNQQLTYDKNTGEVTEWKVKPKNKLDEISAHHDICYDMGKNKGECDKQMVKSIDQIPWKDKPWEATAVRNIINTKQKLGLGVKSKNGKSRRVGKRS